MAPIAVPLTAVGNISAVCTTNRAKEADTNTLQNITTAVKVMEDKDTEKVRIRPMEALQYDFFVFLYYQLFSKLDLHNYTTRDK